MNLKNKEILSRLDKSRHILKMLPGYVAGEIYEEIWVFENINGRLIKVDFSRILLMIENHKNKKFLKEYDLLNVIKLLWLSISVKSTPSIDTYIAKLTGLMLFFEAILDINCIDVNKTNIKPILKFILVKGLNKDVVDDLPKIASYSSFIIRSNISQIQQAIIDSDLYFMSHNIGKVYIQKILEKLVPEITDGKITYRDWVEGGSYDLLSLDHGRYYIEHCLNFFEDNISVATALSRLLKDKESIANDLKFKPQTVSDSLALIMRGFKPVDIVNRWSLLSSDYIEKIYSESLKRYNLYLKESLLVSKVLSDDGAKLILLECGIENTQENIDRIKFISWKIVRNNLTTKGLEALDSPLFRIIAIKNQIFKLKESFDNNDYLFPSEREYASIGLDDNKNIKTSSTYQRQLIRYVSVSGLISVVALTGWRSREFGFPLSSIIEKENLDKLDSHAFPSRYFVNWYIQKTNGKTRLDREITFYLYILIYRLSELNGSADDSPCLYETLPSNKNIFSSNIPIQRNVKVMWPHFVKNYKGFIDIKSKPDNSIDFNLKYTYEKITSEFPRIEFFLTKSTSQVKRNWLSKYRSGTLKKEWAKILDEYLSEDTKTWIGSLPEKSLSSPKTTNYVSGILTEGTIYPSSHSFRHMWAEAIYRRFDGDAGWMIRSQFKHISKSMWLAYIRDKDNRLTNEQTQKKVISSIVKNYLVNKGNGYTGQFHKWLRRLSRVTSIDSHEGQFQLANSLAMNEIDSIKASPWGYCLLRKRSYFKAKCAISGSPQRHNASPSICLNCTHNLMQKNNVDWALMHVSQHVEAIKSDKVPVIFQESSYKLVKNVFANTKMLDSNHDALPELKEALECYIDRRNNA